MGGAGEERQAGGGGGGGGEGGGGLVVVKRREEEKRVDAFRGSAGGRGRGSNREADLLLMLVWCVEKEI